MYQSVFTLSLWFYLNTTISNARFNTLCAAFLLIVILYLVVQLFAGFGRLTRTGTEPLLYVFIHLTRVTVNAEENRISRNKDAVNNFSFDH